jgi:hypothetical protein
LYLTAKDMWNLFTMESQTNTWFSGKVLQSWCARSLVRIPLVAKFLLNFPTCWRGEHAGGDEADTWCGRLTWLRCPHEKKSTKEMNGWKH